MYLPDRVEPPPHSAAKLCIRHPGVPGRDPAPGSTPALPSHSWQPTAPSAPSPSDPVPLPILRTVAVSDAARLPVVTYPAPLLRRARSQTDLLRPQPTTSTPTHRAVREIPCYRPPLTPRPAASDSSPAASPESAPSPTLGFPAHSPYRQPKTAPDRETYAAAAATPGLFRCTRCCKRRRRRHVVDIPRYSRSGPPSTPLGSHSAYRPQRLRGRSPTSSATNGRKPRSN